jgi:hypothetical protein
MQILHDKQTARSTRKQVADVTLRLTSNGWCNQNVEIRMASDTGTWTLSLSEEETELMVTKLREALANKRAAQARR